MPSAKDLTDQRFGKLVATRYESVQGKRFWLCVCDCGGEEWILTRDLLKKNRKPVRACNVCRAKSCPVCGSSFLPRTTQITCSEICREQYEQNYNAEYRRDRYHNDQEFKERAKQLDAQRRQKSAINNPEEVKRSRRERYLRERDHETDEERLERLKKLRQKYHENKQHIAARHKIWREEMSEEKRRKHRISRARYHSQQNLKNMTSVFDAFLNDGNNGNK